MYVKKHHQFLKSIKKMHAKESWLLLSALRCRRVIGADQSAAVRTPRAHLGRLDSVALSSPLEMQQTHRHAAAATHLAPCVLSVAQRCSLVNDCNKLQTQYKQATQPQKNSENAIRGENAKLEPQRTATNTGLCMSDKMTPRLANR